MSNDTTPTFAPTGAGAYRMRNGLRVDLVPITGIGHVSSLYVFLWQDGAGSSWLGSGQHCGGRLSCSMDIVGPWAETPQMPVPDRLSERIAPAFRNNAMVHACLTAYRMDYLLALEHCVEHCVEQLVAQCDRTMRDLIRELRRKPFMVAKPAEPAPASVRDGARFPCGPVTAAIRDFFAEHKDELDHVSNEDIAAVAIAAYEQHRSRLSKGARETIARALNQSGLDANEIVTARAELERLP